MKNMRTTVTAVVFVLVLIAMLVLVPYEAQSTTEEHTLFLGDAGPVSTSFIAGANISTSELVFSSDMQTLNGSDLQDFAGGDNDGTISGATPSTSGIVGSAYTFTASVIALANESDFDLQTLSITGWMFPQEPSDGGTIDSPFSKANSYGYSYDHSNPLFRGCFFIVHSAVFEHCGGPITWFQGVWQHFAASWDGTIIRMYRNGTEIVSRNVGSQTLDNVADPFRIGDGNAALTQPFDGRIDEVTVWNRTLTPAEIATLANVGQEYAFRFEAGENPGDEINEINWIGNASQVWGASTYLYDNPAVFDGPGYDFTANATVWVAQAISWNSFANVSDLDVGFNLTLATGTYPYWVNNTHQANLTTVAGAISFNWTDWLDGEHLFELGMVFTSIPITTGEIGIGYSYQAAVTKTSITGWNLTTGPGWASVSSGGLITGTPASPGLFAVTIQANATGGVAVSQSFNINVPAIPVPPSLTNTGILFMIGFIPFLLTMGIGFWKEQGALIMVGGIIGVVLGLWLIFALQDFGDTWIFGFAFVGIGILFSYIGWVNTDRIGGGL